jgi:hypothetical protein
MLRHFSIPCLLRQNKNTLIAPEVNTMTITQRTYAKMESAIVRLCDYILDFGRDKGTPICITEYRYGTRVEQYANFERRIYNTGDVVDVDRSGKVIYIRTHDGILWEDEQWKTKRK